MKNIIMFSILFLVFFLTENSFPQDDLRDQYDYAYRLYQEEDYFSAVTEFKRLIFFDKKSEFGFDANKLIGESYKQGIRFDDAIKYFSIAKLHSQNESQKFDLTIKIIQTNILRNTTSRALQLLDSLEAQKVPGRNREIFYWRGWALIFQDEWDKAAQQFILCDTAMFLAEYCEKVDEQKYSEDFAKFSSIILPGAGQFYTGDYLSGVMSFGWNLLSGYLSVNSFIEDRAFDGMMATVFLWARFYRGNIQNAESFAVGKNLEIANNALKFLQTSYIGEKP